MWSPTIRALSLFVSLFGVYIAICVGLAWLTPSSVGQVPPAGQCVSTALAGGSADAISIARLPCTPTTTLLILNITATNTTNAPTVTPVGGPTQAVRRYTGAYLQPGDLIAGSYVQLTNNGANWFLLTVPPSAATLTSPTPGPNVFGMPPYENVPGGQFTATQIASGFGELVGVNKSAAAGQPGVGVAGTSLQDGTQNGSFPTAVLAYAKLATTVVDQYATGINAVVDCMNAGICSNELDANNFSGIQPTGIYPPVYTGGHSWAQGLFLGCGGNARCYYGLGIGANAFHGQLFDVGVYVKAAETNLDGILVDALPLGGPQYSANLRNPGQGASINLVLQTMGTMVKSNQVISMLDASGSVHYSLFQDGHVVGLGFGSESSGHVRLGNGVGMGGPGPILSACGTGPVLAGGSTDSVGGVSPGGGSPTSCTITFGTTYSDQQRCQLTGLSAVPVYLSAQSTAAITITAMGGTLGGFNYFCTQG